MSQTTAEMPDLRHLRPLSVAEMADRAFALMFQRPGMVLALAAVVAAPEIFYVLARVSGIFAGDASRLFAIFLLLTLMGTWAQGAAIAGLFQTYLFPKRALTAKSLAKVSFERLPAFFLTLFVLYELIVAPLLVVIPHGLLTGAGSPPGTTPAPLSATTIVVSLFSIFLGARLAIGWMLVPAAVMIEQRSFFRSALRSSELLFSPFRDKAGRLSGAWPRLSLLLALLFLGMATCYALLNLACLAFAKPGFSPLQYIFAPTYLSDLKQDATRQALLASSYALFSLVVAPLMWCGTVLLYTECRIRREGLDFQVRLIEGGVIAPEMTENPISANQP